MRSFQSVRKARDRLRHGGSPAIRLRLTRQRRRLLVDRLVRLGVIASGFLIVLAISAIFVVIFCEAVPLFYPARASLRHRVIPQSGSEPKLAIGVDDYGENAFFVGADGRLDVISLGNGEATSRGDLLSEQPGRFTCLSSIDSRQFAAGTKSSKIVPFRIEFVSQFENSRRITRPEVTVEKAVQLTGESQLPLRNVAYAKSETREVFVAQGEERRVSVIVRRLRKGLGGTAVQIQSDYQITVPTVGEVERLALDGKGRYLFGGSSVGEIFVYDLGPSQGPVIISVQAVLRQEYGISALGLVLGDQTLIAGDRGGNVTSWILVSPEQGDKQRLQQLYRFQSHGHAVVGFSRSQRNRTFVTLDETGDVKLHYAMTGETLLSLPQQETSALRSIALAPKGNRLIGVKHDGVTIAWDIFNPHPEAALSTFFSRIWYEGYDLPSFVWQSSASTDDVEAKLSLVPLIFGTLKGTFYALLLAVPIAVFGALYSSEFMHRGLREIIKPLIELMAGIPTVVIGFIAGLWLAPNLSPIVPGLFLAPLVLCALIFAAALLCNALPRGAAGLVPRGSEILLLVPITVLALILSFQLGSRAEKLFFDGDYQLWFRHAFGVHYDQRNSLVVGIAMAIAVIPIIYTIAEDTLTSVPQQLRAASYALGANRWQTAFRVVLPAASPGIFSAVMIGFGRAVGETMIVLMATGNTPIIDASVFNGFRALSANIAVELPEAAHGSTLYRVLFFSALLLFLVTFSVNTATEMVRRSIRQRFRQL